MTRSLAGAVCGALVGALLAGALALFVAAVAHEAEPIMIGLAAGAVGGLFGSGVGLAVGAARATVEGSLWTIIARGPRRSVSDAGPKPPGLSRLDVLLSVVHGSALAGLALVVLLFACDGPRGVRRLAEFGHVASPSVAHSVITLVGSLLTAATLVLLARVSQRPPLRRLGRKHVRGATASGFFCGLVWPEVLLLLCAG